MLPKWCLESLQLKVMNENQANIFWAFDLILIGLQLCDPEGLSPDCYANTGRNRHPYRLLYPNRYADSSCPGLYPS